MLSYIWVRLDGATGSVTRHGGETFPWSILTVNVPGGEGFDAAANAALAVVLCLIGVWPGRLVAVSPNPAKGF